MLEPGLRSDRRSGLYNCDIIAVKREIFSSFKSGESAADDSDSFVFKFDFSEQDIGSRADILFFNSLD